MQSLRTLTAAIALVLLVLPLPLKAQLLCEGSDLMAITFDAEGTVLDIHHVENLDVFTAYFWLMNSQFDALGGFELGYEVTGEFSHIQTTFTSPQALNVGQADNMIVGLGTPQPIIDGRALLCTQEFLYSSPVGDPVVFHLRPTQPASISGQMAYLAPGNVLTAAFPISEDYSLPAATVNGAPLHYCQEIFIDGVTVGIASQGDEDNLLGASSVATNGFDPGLDLIDDGPDPVVYFFHPEWDHQQGDRFRQDIIAGFDEHATTRTWSFVVDSEIPEGMTPPYTVGIDFTPSFADDPSVIMTLVDTSTEEITILEAPYTYEYGIDADETRIFELTVGNDTVYPPQTFLDLRVDVHCNGLADLGNHAGADEAASDGFDSGFDNPEPSPPPGNYLVASFWQPEWPFGPRFRTMVHGSYDLTQDYKTWSLRVETDQVGTVTMDFAPSFQANEGILLYLRDEASGAVVSLFPQLGFSYLNQIPSVREFTLIIGNAGPPPASPDQRTLQDGWNLVGLPLTPPEGEGTIGDVLMDPFTNDTYVFRYENPDGYVEEEAANPVVTGLGYWLAVYGDQTWSMDGEMELDPISVDLTEGWNMVGYPLWFTTNLEGSTVQHQGSFYSWNQAADAGLILGSLLEYDSASDLYQATENWTPYHGYWVGALEPDVTLIFDWRSLVNPPWERRPPNLYGHTPEQLWRTEVQATTRDQQTFALTFGVHPEATEGFDTHLDIPRSPSSPRTAGYFGILRPEMELPTGETLMQDLITPGLREFHWDADLVTAGSGPVILEWDNHSWPADLDLQIYLPRENRVVVMSMRETDRVQLNISGGYEKLRFRTPMLSGVGETPAASFSLAAHPNPFNPRTSLKYYLPRGGDAAIRIYNLRGELITELRDDGAEAGAHTVDWQGVDRAGRSVPSGSYFAKLFLDGEGVGPITKMSLVR